MEDRVDTKPTTPAVCRGGGDCEQSVSVPNGACSDSPRLLTLDQLGRSVRCRGIRPALSYVDCACSSCHLPPARVEYFRQGFTLTCQTYPCGPGLKVLLNQYDRVYEEQYGKYEFKDQNQGLLGSFFKK